MILRIRIITIFVILFSVGIVVRLYFLQIVHGNIYAEDAERQYKNKNTILYDRGAIYFTQKDGESAIAAISRTGFTVAINPSITKEPQYLFDTLNKIIPLDKEEFFAKANKKNDQYEELVSHLSSETIEKIKALNLYGITISTDKKRFYPGGKVASQTIGFVAYNGNELAGRYGLERSYEEVLKKNPNAGYENFFTEFFSNVKESFKDIPEQSGDIYTTIEPSVQMFIENELETVRNKWQSDTAGAIVINPKNGEILGMAWSPGFDLNKIAETKIERFSNPIVEGVYEMGSIIKPITIASGLDAKIITSTTTYFDNGFLVLNEKRISNYDGKGRGVATMQDVLGQSLNTGVAFVAQKLGNKRFAEYFKKFAIDTETGIDLPSEATGLTENLDSERSIEIATASYGQGIALTPIATVRALSVLANGGTLVVPHIVKKIKYENGMSKKISFPPNKRVISENASKEITKMLVNVVDKSLRGGTAKIHGYSIAAKTGTAQMTDEGVAGYAEGKYLHSFFGYFPASDPQFLVFLFHTYPKDVRYASETLTDPFLNIAKFILNYYEIPPDRPED